MSYKNLIYFQQILSTSIFIFRLIMREFYVMKIIDTLHCVLLIKKRLIQYIEEPINKFKLESQLKLNN